MFTENKEINVRYASIVSSNEETISLFDLDPNFIQIDHREIKYLLFGVLLFLSSIPIFVNAYNLREPGVTMFALFFIIPALFCFIEYFRKSFKQVIVKYYNNGENAILFWLNSPKKEDYEKFINELVDRINSVKLNPRLSISEKLEIYFNNLSFLVDEKVITEEECNSIMNRTENNINKQTADVVKIVK